MKKSILSIACLLMAFIGSARADDHITGVSQKVQRSFNEKFVGAREISWTKEGEFNRASFNFNNQVLYAYFEADGTLVATARNILSDKLPLNLLFSLHREYSDYWISSLVEVDSEWSVQYYLTIESPNKIITLKSDDGGSWEIIKKMKKE